MSPQHEARREPRHNAEGSVRVEFRNPQKRELEGQLVDFSASGFRMAHASMEPPAIRDWLRWRRWYWYEKSDEKVLFPKEKSLALDPAAW